MSGSPACIPSFILRTMLEMLPVLTPVFLLISISVYPCSFKPKTSKSCGLLSGGMGIGVGLQDINCYRKLRYRYLTNLFHTTAFIEQYFSSSGYSFPSNYLSSHSICPNDHASFHFMESYWKETCKVLIRVIKSESK